MRKAFLAILLALACSAGAAVITIPPDVPASVSRPAGGGGAAPAPTFPANWLFYFRDAEDNYVSGIDGADAVWTDPETGAVATQSTHLRKPQISGKGLVFASVSSNAAMHVSSALTQYPSSGFEAASGTFAICVRYGSVANSNWLMSQYTTDLAPLLGVYSGSAYHFIVLDNAAGGIKWTSPDAPQSGDFRTYVIRNDILPPSGPSKAYMYVNGVPDATTWNGQSWRKPFTFGNQNEFGPAWSGFIYAVAHWNRNLTDDEITMVHNTWKAKYE
jgi:hypothetical protein